MMAPEAPALMGITNEGRDIPVRQLAGEGTDGRYVISLVNIRKIHEFIFHRRQDDVLIFHQADTNFTRLAERALSAQRQADGHHRYRVRRSRLPAAARLLVRPHSGPLGHLSCADAAQEVSASYADGVKSPGAYDPSSLRDTSPQTGEENPHMMTKR